jgi:hypothetical protein
MVFFVVTDEGSPRRSGLSELFSLLVCTGANLYNNMAVIVRSVIYQFCDVLYI